MDQKKQKMSRDVQKLSSTSTELLDVETGGDSAVTDDRKCVKWKKKLSSTRDLDTPTATEQSLNTSSESQHSVNVNKNHAKHLPAKADRNSGVVRIIEKSQHKNAQRTRDLEEALHLDVGLGTCQW